MSLSSVYKGVATTRPTHGVRDMKCAFVRFVEERSPEDGGEVMSFALARGKHAESHEAFVEWHQARTPVRIIIWFEVPEKWQSIVDSEESMNDAFEALLGLDALSDSPVVSDLLVTVFAAGLECGERHRRNVETEFARLSSSDRR